MKKSLFILWLLVPIAMIAWHYGPGQAQLRRDRAGERLRDARAAADAEDWGRAAQLYEQAAKALPDENVADRQRLQLAQAHRASGNAAAASMEDETATSTLDRLTSDTRP